MRILLTNTALANRSGSELYVRDLATALLDRGHLPIVYSPVHGEVADEIRKATIPVVDDLEKIAGFPDIIHGHHHFETMTALLRFPGIPALYVCHGWLPWEEIPPRFPRILRYLAVDHTCRDRLIYEHAIPEERVQVLLNFVDLQRFLPRPPLPTQPQRALLFSNAAQEKTHLGVVQEACARTGLTLDVMGRQAGSASAHPEAVLGEYDIVFAKGRCALEALAVGAAVILCDAVGAGPMVTAQELEQLRALNCGIRTLREPLTPDVLVREIARYNPSDAARVSQHIRTTAGREATIDTLILLYQTILKEYVHNKGDEASVEGTAAAAYFRWLSPILKGKSKIVNERLEAHCTRLQTALAAARTRASEAEAAAKAVRKALEARETELHQLQSMLEAAHEQIRKSELMAEEKRRKSNSFFIRKFLRWQHRQSF